MKKYILMSMLLIMNIVFCETNIGFIDSFVLKTQYEGFKTAAIELENEQKQIQIELNALQTQYDSLLQSYESQRLLMSEERQKEKEAELIQKQIEAEEFMMKRVGPQNSQLIQLAQRLESPHMKILLLACEVVATKKQYDYVVDASAGLMWANPAHNITQEVLEEMNKLSSSGSE